MTGPVPTRRSRAALDILVVEDTVASQKLVAKMLRAAGHTVRIAANGVEALRTYSRKLPDLILMDLQMPILDGLSTTSILRALMPSGRRVPIIATTARRDPLDRERCQVVGVDAFLPKPFGPDELLSTIDDVLPPAPSGPVASSVVRPAGDEPGETDSPTLESAPQAADLGVALARLGNDGRLLNDLIGFFFDDFPALLTEIREGLALHDWHRVHRASHSLKGLVANFNAAPAVEALGAVEESCAKRKTEATVPLVAVVDREMARLAAALADHYATEGG